MSQPKVEFDTPWKKVLDVYFKDFMAYCWPEKHAEINWDKGYKLLDKELSKIARNAPVGNRIIDKLIEIKLKNGEQAYVLLHIEVQGNLDPQFEERMFVYRYRLRDSHPHPIASLAILIDNDEGWRPHVYREQLWDSSLEMRFPIIKLIDYKSQIKELEASPNRFATVILAQLAALEQQPADAKLISKVKLIKWLYSRAWPKEDIMTLLTFIDWVLALPASFELKFREAVGILEEELHMNYVTSFERIGIEKGVQQGESALLLRQLQHKFKTVPEAYLKQLEQANAETLLKWGERILDSQALEDVFRA